ncbi:hypothetical protein BGX31_008749 [Mortierella sp. GBA43]|nr:hypothetical protein BGX31_008749 [Mortierella sp. GBA43]
MTIPRSNSANSNLGGSSSNNHGNSNGNNINNYSNSNSRKVLLHQPEGLRPLYHPLASMGLMQQPPRSLSFAGSATANAAGQVPVHRASTTTATPHSDSDNWFSIPHSRKVQSVGKGAKKGFKSRLKKLRRKQGSSGSREASNVNASITSCDESDSEVPFEPDTDIMFNSGGIIHRYIPTIATSSKSSGFSRPKVPPIDPGLPPPQLPPRRNSVLGTFGWGRDTISGAHSGPEYGGHETPRESFSTVRFKDLFKNVGLSNPHSTSGSGSLPVTTANTIDPLSGPSDRHYPQQHGSPIHPPVTKPTPSRSTFHALGFLSGDDQPATNSAGGSLSKGFRLKGTGKRKKRFTKKATSAADLATNFHITAVTDDEDSSTSRTGRRRLSIRPKQRQEEPQDLYSQHQPQQQKQKQKQKQQQQPQQQQQRGGGIMQWNSRYRSRSTGEEGRFQAPFMNLAAWKPEPRISAELKKARQESQDPNVLIVELEPLPKSFEYAYAALSSCKASHHQPQYPLQQQYQQPQSQPPHLHHAHSQSLSTLDHMVAHVTPSGIAGSASSSGQVLPLLYGGSSTTLMPTIMSVPPMMTGTIAGSGAVMTTTMGTQPRCSDSLLTKTFLFRFHQNSKFQGHYIFRVVKDRVEYKILPRSLEPACEQYFREAYVAYRTLEKKAKALKDEKVRSHRMTQFWTTAITTVSPPTSPTASMSRALGPLDGPSPNATGNSSNSSTTTNTNSTGHQSQGPEEKIVKSTIAWDQMIRFDTGAGYPLGRSPMPRPTFPPPSRSIGYQDQRYNPQRSHNSIVRSFAGGSGVGGVMDRSKSDFTEKNTITNINTTEISPIPPPLPPRSTTHHSHTRNRSWTSAKEQQQRLDPLTQEEHNLREMELKYREEARQAAYGLQLYLNTIIQGLEYERFDISADVEIVNDNRENAVFTIVNGDGTNEMSLESPSVKLKDEFINWIKISGMGYDEATQDPVPLSCDNAPVGISSLDMLLGPRKGYSDTAGPELLLEMTELRQALQEEKMQQMRKRIQSSMREIESCLSQLDDLDDNAKKRMTEMTRAIDGHELQLALSPSTDGKTLAVTVQSKLRDVGERIQSVKKIVYFARFDLERLKYEIELEQRSIRLFRQYKIIIAIIILTVLVVFWTMYTPSRTPTMFDPAVTIPVYPVEQNNPLYQHFDPLDMQNTDERAHREDSNVLHTDWPMRCVDGQQEGHPLKDTESCISSE